MQSLGGCDVKYLSQYICYKQMTEFTPLSVYSYEQLTRPNVYFASLTRSFASISLHVISINVVTCSTMILKETLAGGR